MAVQKPGWAARIYSLFRTLFVIALVGVAALVLLYFGIPTPPNQGSTDMACARITGRDLAALFANPQPDPRLSDRLQALFGVPVEAETLAPLRAGSTTWPRTFYRWNYADADYRLTQLNSQPLHGSVVYPWGDAPAVSRVLECLGSPTAYTALLVTRPKGQRVLDVALVYNDRGIIVSLEAMNRGWFSPAIDTSNAMQLLGPASLVRGIRWTQPGDIQAMDWRSQPNQGMPDAADQATFNDERAAYYRTFRPWPGSIEALVLTDSMQPAPSGCCAADLPRGWLNETTSALVALLVLFLAIDAFVYHRYGKAGLPNSWRWELTILVPGMASGLVLGLLIIGQEFRGFDLVRGTVVICVYMGLILRVGLKYKLRRLYPASPVAPSETH